MLIPVIAMSALEFWMNETQKINWEEYSFENRSLISLPKQYRLECNDNFIIAFAKEYDLSLPVTIMVANRNQRLKGESFCCVARPDALPYKSFIRLDNAVVISSPELCFLQIAKELSFCRLVEAANNLCGTYVKSETAEFGQKSRSPLTDVESIEKFLKQAEGMHGIKKAKSALQFAENHTHSPMESILAVLACLPIFRGGYALRKMEVNGIVRLSPEAAKLFGKETCCCDMLWEDVKVVLEYDSTLTHLRKEQHFRDKRKYTALTMSGYKVIAITAEQVRSFRSVEETFQSIRKVLGMRNCQGQFDKYLEERHQVVEELLGSYWRRQRSAVHEELFGNC